MTIQQIYTINEPEVIFEEFGDEIVAVHLDTGIYYSLRGSACDIWLSLKFPTSIHQILDVVLEKYEGNIDEIDAHIHQFINRLMSMNLIKTSNITPQVKSISNHLSIKSTFLPPEIDIFSDMQDILLLDPVHDVDETGWPILKGQKDIEGN
jgi:hypothetical protein